MKKQDELINKIFFKKYKILKKIGKGSFGLVYLCKQINTENYFAMKFEPKEQQDLILEHESYILYYLKGFGIPDIITYGHNSKYNILVQTLLGKSINSIFLHNNNKFSIKDCCMIGIQILERLEYIHSKYIIHRDIKPDNFLIGNPDINTIYIIDFGLAKKFMSSRTGKHAKFCINKKWSGTSRFASANSLRGVAQSRRDDLESLCYLLLYLLKGSLPWDNVYGKNENEEILLIYKIKKFMKPELLFMNLPKETAEFFKYCKKLEYEQKPDYTYLKNLLLNILNYSNEKNDLNFSWVINYNNNNRNEISSYNNIDINKAKYKHIVKRKNSPRQKIYDKIMNKKINSVKRSESCNKVINLRNILQIENKVKKDCPIVKNISPNLRHMKFNNLFKNEKIQKYKYIKKIPIGNRKIIIQTNNLNKISPNDNSIIETHTETGNIIKKGKVNIIPLNNVSKHSKSNKLNNIPKNNITEKKIIFKKKLGNSSKEKNQEIKKHLFIRKNNSYNFKDSKNLKLFKYISYNNNINYNSNNDADLISDININNRYSVNNAFDKNKKINIIMNNRSYTKQSNFNSKFKNNNFESSLDHHLNNNFFEFNELQTFNDNNSYSSNNKKYISNLNSLKINTNKINNYNYNYNQSLPYQINNKNNLNNINNYNKKDYISYLNIFDRNDLSNYKKQERINLTNNNIQNNYNINIDINDRNKEKINQKDKKDIKIINIISPMNKNLFYHKVKKNSLSPNIPHINKIKTKINQKENSSYISLLNHNYKNDLFEKYFTNADVMKKYNKIKNSITFNKQDKYFENSFNNIKRDNIFNNNNNNLFFKEDLNSYDGIRRTNHNNLIRNSHSLRYVSPKSIEKYKNIY